MGFWDVLGSMMEKGVEKALEYRDNYEDSYSNSSERYSNMTNEQLKREVQRLKDESGTNAKRMGKMKAMSDEIENRRN